MRPRTISGATTRSRPVCARSDCSRTMYGRRPSRARERVGEDVKLPHRAPAPHSARARPRRTSRAPPRTRCRPPVRARSRPGSCAFSCATKAVPIAVSAISDRFRPAALALSHRSVLTVTLTVFLRACGVEERCSHWRPSRMLSMGRNTWVDVAAVNSREPDMTTSLPSRADVVIIGGGIVGCSIAYHLTKLGITDVLLLERRAAHLRHDLARGRADRAAAGDAADDRARQVHLRAAARAGGRDRAGDRVQAERLDQPRAQRRAVRGAEARRLDGQELRPRGRGDRPGRDQGALPAARGRRRGRRRVPAQGRPGQPDRHHPGLRQGRPPARRPDRRGRQGRAHPGRAGQGGGRDDRAGAGRRLDRGARRRHVVARAGGRRRRLGAAARGRALLHRHRAPGRGAARPAGAAGHRRVHLLQGGCRQAAGRRLRAGGQALGHGRHPRGLLLRQPARGHGPLRADPGEAPPGACRSWPPPASRPSSTARRASPRTTATCSARPPSCATCSSPAASTRSASRARAAPARCWPNGSATAACRSTSPTSTCAACTRSRATAPTCATAPPRPWACSTPCTGPTGSTPPPAACAARRSTTGWSRPVPSWARRRAGSGRTGTRRPASSPSTATPGAARTGSSTRPPNAGRCAMRWACSTSRASPSSWSRAADACAVLNRLSVADMDVPAGRDRLHPMVQRAGRHRGRPHRHAPGRDQLPRRHRRRRPDPRPRLAREHIPAEARCTVVDITSGLPMLGLMGPRSRDLLQQLSGEDLSNAAFPFGTSRELEIGYARVRASRITYVGELGWELYVPAEFATHVFDRIVEAGREFGLTPRRLPRHERLPHREGLPPLGPRHRPRGRPARGRPRLLRRLGQARRVPRPRGAAAAPARPARRPAAWSSSASWTTAKLLYHEEPVWAGGRIVGSVTSGMYGHRVGAPLGMGYLHHEGGVTQAWLDGSGAGDRGRLGARARQGAARAVVRPEERADFGPEALATQTRRTRDR